MTQLLPNEVVTEQQSIVVVKKLLAIAVSAITYLRGIFPGKAYGTKYVEGLILYNLLLKYNCFYSEFFFFFSVFPTDQQVMILTGGRNCPGAGQIIDW